MEQAEIARRVSEVERCSDGLAGFLYWCEEHCRIEDKRADYRDWFPFKLYGCQKRVAERLISGNWLAVLKARQLGLTTLVIAYALWRHSFTKMWQTIILNQTVTYAEEFINRFRGMRSHLPTWLQPEIIKGQKDNTSHIRFGKVGGTGGEIQSLAAKEGSGRTLTADLLVADEASRILLLREVLQASEPTLETSGGQCVLITTSRGPANEFAHVYNKSARYEKVFLSWDEHPRRDQDWYDKEAYEHRHLPLYMGQEFPSTAEEAFAMGPGRACPMFRYNNHVRDEAQILDLAKCKNFSGWTRYRCIDFGTSEQHPFVCLWILYRPGPPAFYVEPKCENLIRELVEYRRNPKTGELLKEDDHTVDAIRYLITTERLTGFVWVYREYYIVDSASLGRTVLDHSETINDLSGWVEVREHVWRPGARGENFESTVADRNGREQIMLMMDHGLDDIVPAIDIQTKKIPFRTQTKGEREMGIEWLNGLIVGSVPFDTPDLPPDKREQQRDMLRRERFMPRASKSIQQMFVEQGFDDEDERMYGSENDVMGCCF